MMFQKKVLKHLWIQDDPETICNRLEAVSQSQSIEDSVWARYYDSITELADKLGADWKLEPYWTGNWEIDK